MSAGPIHGRPRAFELAADSRLRFVPVRALQLAPQLFDPSLRFRARHGLDRCDRERWSWGWSRREHGRSGWGRWRGSRVQAEGRGSHFDKSDVPEEGVGARFVRDEFVDVEDFRFGFLFFGTFFGAIRVFDTDFVFGFFSGFEEGSDRIPHYTCRRGGRRRGGTAADIRFVLGGGASGRRDRYGECRGEHGPQEQSFHLHAFLNSGSGTSPLVCWESIEQSNAASAISRGDAGRRPGIALSVCSQGRGRDRLQASTRAGHLREPGHLHREALAHA
jgi:hypothetical protein